MSEELEKQPESEEAEEKKISCLIHSLEYRNPFQTEVLNLLIADNIITKKDRDEIVAFGKIISDFIDNPENIEIRNLIIEKRFNEAAEKMVAEIQREKTAKAA